MQQHKRDELVQAGPDELDPSQWTGNQRVIHFGPMAQRDPFFYFYPKGWDLLYPAHFGFFPYRTKFVYKIKNKELYLNVNLIFKIYNDLNQLKLFNFAVNSEAIRPSSVCGHLEYFYCWAVH